MKNRCRKSLIKNFKRELIENFFPKKWLTTHIEREHAGFTNSLHCKHSKKKSNSNVLEKTNNKNRTLIVGESFSGKTSLMLKFLS